MMGGCTLDSSDSGQELMMNSCEHGNEPLSSATSQESACMRRTLVTIFMYNKKHYRYWYVIFISVLQQENIVPV
jgi:hypothetical protein